MELIIIIIIPNELIECKRVYPQDEQEYFKFLDQLWLYERWSKRTNQQIPTLANRIFNLRNKLYNGFGFHYSMERTLGSLISKLNDYDNCPDKPINMALRRITIKVITNDLFRSVANAESSCKKGRI